MTAERDQLLLQVEQLRAEQQRLTAANLRVRNEAQAGLDQRHVHFNRDTDLQQVRMVPPPLRGPFQPRGQPQPGASQFVQGALPQPASTSAGFPSSVMANPVRQSIGGALAGAATAAVPVQQQMQLQATTRTVASHQYRQPPPSTSANLSAPGTWEQRSRYGSTYQPTIPVSNNDWQWDASQQQPRMQLPQQQPRMQLQVQAALPAISASPVYAADLARVNSVAGPSGAAQQQRAQRNLNDDWQYQETMQLSAEEQQMAQLSASIAARKVNLGIQNVDPSGSATGLPGMAGVNVQQLGCNQFAALNNQLVTPQQQLQSGMQQYVLQPLHSTLQLVSRLCKHILPGMAARKLASGFGNTQGTQDVQETPERRKRNQEIDAKRKNEFEINSESLKASKSKTRGNMKCEVDKFERGTDLTIKDWINQMETYFVIGQVPSDAFVGFMMTKIVPKHLKEIDQHRKLDYLEFREKLIEVFEEPDMATAYLNELSSINQERDESMSVFMHRVRLLVLKAHPDVSAAARERILVHHFLVGLHDKQLAASLAVAKVQTASEAERLAAEGESVRRDQRSRRSNFNYLPAVEQSDEYDIDQAEDCLEDFGGGGGRPQRGNSRPQVESSRWFVDRTRPKETSYKCNEVLPVWQKWALPVGLSFEQESEESRWTQFYPSSSDWMFAVWWKSLREGLPTASGREASC